MKKFTLPGLWRFFAAVGLSLIVASGPRFAAAQETINIGVILPLTGPNADSVKRDLITPIELAVKHANAEGGALGKQIKLFEEDPNNNPATAAAALRKLVDVNHILADITGFTYLTFPQLPIADEKKVIVLAPGVAHPDLTKDLWTVRFATTSARYAKKTAQIADQLEVKTVVYFGEDTEAGRTFQTGFTNEFVSHGGKIIGTDKFGPNDNDMSAQLTKLKSYDADAIYNITSSGRPTALILKQMAEVGFRPKHSFNSFLMESPDVQALSPDLTNGVIWPSLAVDPEFAKKYQAEIGIPPSSLAACAYASVQMFVAAIKRVGSLDTTKLRDAMYNYGPFQNPAGTFTYAGSGEPEVTMAVKTMKDGKIADFAP